MKYLYGTYRGERLTNPYELGNLTSLNGTYTPSMFLNNQFGDWHAAGLTNLVDNIIPEERYVGEIVPGIKKLTRFLVFEYNEEYVDPLELERSAENVGRRFDIDILTIEEARVWIKANTDLVEIEPNLFEISPETIGIMGGEIIPQKLLDLR